MRDQYDIDEENGKFSSSIKNKYKNIVNDKKISEDKRVEVLAPK